MTEPGEVRRGTESMGWEFMTPKLRKDICSLWPSARESLLEWEKKNEERKEK